MTLEKHKHTRWQRQGWLGLLGVGLLLFLSACGTPTPMGQSAQQEQARLNTEIAQAVKLGVPDNMLVPIRQQESRVANSLAPVSIFGDKNSDGSYQNAITSYKVLESEVASVVAQAANQARYQANQDIQGFEAMLQQRQNQGFANEIPAYESRMAQVQQQFKAGVTPNDFYQVSAYAKQQTEALQLLWPAYQQLQSLQDSINRMKQAKLNTALGQQEYQNDLATFRAASVPDDYQKLMSTLSAQIDQLAADQVAAIPFIGAAMLNTFQQQITQAQTYGVNVSTFQQQLAQDQQALQNAHSLQDYLTLSSRIQSQMNNMQGVVIKGKTNYDLNQLKALIATTAITNDYEYRDGTDAYGDQESYYQQAQTNDDYQAVDNQVLILLQNLHALLANLKDTTAHNQPHATDLQLLQDDQAMKGKAVVVSLTEQTMRLYDNGQFVKSIPVATGRMEAPSPPGDWSVFYMGTNLTFKSDEPPNSPLWYPPTPINYGMEYHADGFFLHDATWRCYFGPGSNLPHGDECSGIYSNDGTHGCVNMTLDNTAWLYGWVEIGTPVILY
ncbi:MAG TPA: L,D-transpeptidase [Ktedonobacterales bacterium]|nr:L,D-transpeptidase [Ktedonobacterales bacterium]